MKNKHLLEAARNVVSLHTMGGVRAVDSIIKNAYGIDTDLKNLSLSTIDEIYSLLEKASKRGSSYFGPINGNADPVNEMAKSFGSLSSNYDDTHPMDEIFNIIQSAIELSSKESNRMEDIMKSGRQDPVNDYTREQFLNHSDSDSASSRHSICDIYGLVEDIFKFQCPNENPSLTQDPIGEYVKGGFGTGLFPEQPKHSLLEWNKLLEDATGSNPESDILARSEDVCNDFAAQVLGQEPPSIKALEILTHKMVEATYQITYKLTPGTEEYKFKAEELEQLKLARKKREANLKELNVKN